MATGRVLGDAVIATFSRGEAAGVIREAVVFSDERRSPLGTALVASSSLLPLRPVLGVLDASERPIVLEDEGFGTRVVGVDASFPDDDFGIDSLIGSTFMGGRSDCTGGGVARLPGRVCSPY